MSDPPFWSVIVPTYRREQVLCETIQYLLGLSYPHYELLVIDQTSDHEEETQQFIRTCQDRFPERFRWHFVAIANLPHARNVGAELARGSYLLYCDDDIIPPADLIELHMANLQQPGVGAATGGVYVERKKLPPQPRPLIIFPNGRMRDYWQYEVPKGTTDSLRGGNMSMARQLAVDVDLFDEGYIGRANGEETDFSLRILRRKATRSHTTLPPRSCIWAIRPAVHAPVKTGMRGSTSLNPTTTTPTFSPRISSSAIFSGFSKER